MRMVRAGEEESALLIGGVDILALGCSTPDGGDEDDADDVDSVEHLSFTFSERK